MIEIAMTVLLYALSVWALALAYIGIRATKCQSECRKAQQNEECARVDEQQNSAEDVRHPDAEGHCQACRANTPGKSPSWLCTARQGCVAMEN